MKREVYERLEEVAGSHLSSTVQRRESKSKFNTHRVISHIQQGNREAFEELFREMVLPLCDYAGRFAIREVAEEIVQDVFMGIWVNRASWEPLSMKSYLYGAVRNRAFDYLRHQEVVRQWQEAAPQEAPERPAPFPDRYAQDELSEAVRLAVEQLPERCRAVFLLSRQHDLTYREIAAALDISTKTVESNMRRAFRHLRETLAPYLPALVFITSALLV